MVSAVQLSLPPPAFPSVQLVVAVNSCQFTVTTLCPGAVVRIISAGQSKIKALSQASGILLLLRSILSSPIGQISSSLQTPSPSSSVPSSIVLLQLLSLLSHVYITIRRTTSYDARCSCTKTVPVRIQIISGTITSTSSPIISRIIITITGSPKTIPILI